MGPPGSASAGILLYGLNAAGKSSLMKALGLAVLLAQSGCPVPARAMRIVPYTALYTRILGNDDLWAGLSSFLVELTELHTILRNADARSLVLGDELCKGSETVSATALVAAGVQHLAAAGASFVLATHLHELTALPALRAVPGLAWAHLHVQHDPATDRLTYSRELRAGPGSSLYGLEVAKALRFPETVLAAAEAHRRVLLGEAPEGDLAGAPASRYSAAVSLTCCAVCGARGEGAKLQTHHILPQAGADARGFVAGGVHKNRVSNLAVLCEECHEAHHAGALEVQGWEATSEGRKLRVVGPPVGAAGLGRRPTRLRGGAPVTPNKPEPEPPARAPAPAASPSPPEAQSGGGGRQRRRWTPEEDERLRDALRVGTPLLPLLAHQQGRSLAALKARALALDPPLPLVTDTVCAGASL